MSEKISLDSSDFRIISVDIFMVRMLIEIRV